MNLDTQAASAGETRETDFESQFNLEKSYYLERVDFLNWYRYWFIVKAVVRRRPARILEVGGGDGLLKSCLSPLAAQYAVMDVNDNLTPDILADIRDPISNLSGLFDCVITADVLEHIPFRDLPRALGNIRNYLGEDGSAVITIPHRRTHFLFMTPAQRPRVLTLPTGFASPGAFYRRFIKRKIWIDPHHCWEIGDGRVKRRDVEQAFEEAGLNTVEFRKLVYVDFWVLEASDG